MWFKKLVLLQRIPLCIPFCPGVLDFCGKKTHYPFGSRGAYRSGFCDELLEASPMSYRANASQPQGGPAAAQGQAS